MQYRGVGAFVLLFAGLVSTTSVIAASFGRTAGQFAVSSTGSAQYSIPLWTPPGIHGIQPRLALAYDSHLSYGLMGPGWTLSGLSAISRCNPTYAQDGAAAPITLTTADGFCMDGNRLRGVPAGSTSTYQTEIANFSQVTATAGMNGPAYFTVQGKDGLTYEYGKTTDSKILPSSGTTPYIWALDKVTDRNGNQMTFSYYQAGGAYVPLSIRYTAPSGSTSFLYQVSFNYSTKSTIDTLSKYIAGASVQQTQQLSTITMTSSGTTVREYKLAYTTSSQTGRATLTSIQECGGSAGTDCLSPTSVGYQSGAAGVANPATPTGSGATSGSAFTADIDGDGRQDLVFGVASGANYQWWVQLATATGYGAPMNTGAVTVGTADFLLDTFDGQSAAVILAPISGVFYAYKYNGSGFPAPTSTQVGVVTGAKYSSADVDGDGRPDIVSLTFNATTYASTLSVQFNASTRGTFSFPAAPVSTTFTLGRTCCTLVGNNQQAFSTVKHFDFDGDGRQDLMLGYIAGRQTYAVIPVLSRGSAGFVLGTADYTVQNGSQFEAVQWNDDACTDIVAGANLLISQCNGSVATFITLPETPSLAIDWDGDGRTDLLAANASGTWDLIRSVGNTFAPAVTTGVSALAGNYIVTDPNGDGLDDLAFSESATGSIDYGLHNGAGIHPDLATSFADGYGVTYSPSYVTLSQGAANDYTKGTTRVYPQQDYDGPFTVVTSYTASNGIGGTYTMDYQYSSAVLNLQGRGFAGFGTIRAIDNRNGVNHYRSYSTDFPTVGLVSRESITQSDTSKSITVVSNTLNSLALDSIVTNQRVFPYIDFTSTKIYEVGGAADGTLITTSTTDYSTPDSYGNFSSVTTTLTDNDSSSPYWNSQWKSTQSTTFVPDPSTNWCLNMPTEIYVSNSAPGVPTITRHTSFTPDYGYCRETSQVVEPSSSTYKVSTSFGYDSFGNLNGQTVTGVGMTPRTTAIDWGTSGQFPTTVTNALGQHTYKAFDANNGMQKAETDANNITTRWDYDSFARKITELRPDGTSTTWAYTDCAASACVNSNNKMKVVETILKTDGYALTSQNIYLDNFDRTLVTSKLMIDNNRDRNEVQYDELGRVSKQLAPCVFGSCVSYQTTNTYDLVGRLSKSTRPVSATSSTTFQETNYSYQGRTTTVADPYSHVSKRITMVTGELGRSIDNNNYYTNFNYDAFGSLLSVTDSSSNTLRSMTYYGYGLSALPHTVSDMDLGTRTFTVDALGEVTAYSDGAGHSFSMLYDALSRPVTRTEPDLTTNWVWGSAAASFNIGKLASVSSVGAAGMVTHDYTFDSVGHLSQHTITLPSAGARAFNYYYNATTGLLENVKYPSVNTPTAYRLTANYLYTNGIVTTVRDQLVPSTIWWQANTMNPRGQVTKETTRDSSVDPAMVTQRSYDAVTGWVSSIQTGVGSGAALQNESYLYDEVGNVTQRQNGNAGLTENYFYDGLNRLDHTTGANNLQMAYDGGLPGPGNITSRSDVAGGAAWTYDTTHKHAVLQAGSSSFTYTYDANGNAKTRNGTTIGWTSYNYPSAVGTSTESASFEYGPDRQRWRMIYNAASGTETTYYASPLFEQVATSSGTDYRHYIYVAGRPVMAVSRTAAGAVNVRSLLTDHQGSLSAVVADATGTSYVNESFTPYGNRRDATDWVGPPTAAQRTTMDGVSRQGYTFQTVLGSMGLNHMNGRVQDSVTGRFLSPDPYVPDPSNTQSINRYSYVNNNPLSRIDPSGFDDAGCDGCSFTVIGQIFGDIGSAFSSAGGAIASFFSSLFGGGAQKLNANQQAGQAHKIDISNPIQGAPAGAQVSEGWKYSLDSASATQGPQVASVDELPEQTVIGVRGGALTFESGGTNLAPLFNGIGRYNPLHAGIQTLEFGINGAFLGQAGFGILSIARGSLAAEGGSYLYRGVAAGHDAIEAARAGIAVPRNLEGVLSAAEHNAGRGLADSQFTSWTHDINLARSFAGPDGVILRVPVGPPPLGAPWSWEWSPDIYNEGEVLLQGTRSGCTVLCSW